MDEHGTAGYTPELEPLLTVASTCHLLRVSRQTVYRLVRAGQLNPTRVGERLRFEPSDLRDYLERGRAGT